MKHTQVLKRAWKILWSYRALWVFGFILALTTASASPAQTSQYTVDESYSYQFNTEQPMFPQFAEAMEEGFEEAIEEIREELSVKNVDEFGRQVLTAFLWFAGVVITLALIGQVFRYVAETSLIKMVDDHEDSGERRTVREGFKLGWSREAWRIFLADVIIELPFIAVSLLIIGMILMPILVWSGDNTAASLVGLITGIGLAILLGLLMLAVRAILFVVKPVLRREIALNQATAWQGIRQGFKLARQYWKESGLMGLIIFGINVVWPLVMIPVTLLSLLLSGGLAVSTALLIGRDAFATGDPAMITAIFVGLAVFIIILMIPMGFVIGLKKTYESTTWTLTYREIKALKSLENGDAPEVEAVVPVS
jgi:hypothetical protein